MKRFYDTNALLDGYHLRDTDQFYICNITKRELEQIKTNPKKDIDIKKRAQHLIEWMLDNQDKYETIYYDYRWDDDFINYPVLIPNSSDSRIIMAALHTNENFIFTTHDFNCAGLAEECGLKVEYTSKLTFNCSDPRFKYKTVNDWFVDQEKWIRSYEYQGSDPIFEDENIILHKIFIDHNEEVTRGKLSLYEDYLLIGEKRFDFSSIIEMTVSSKQTLIFYVDDISYRLSSDIVGVNFIKYMQMYYHLNNKKLGFDDDFLGIQMDFFCC